MIPRDGDTVTAGDAQLTWHAVDTIKYNVNLFHFAYALGKPTSNVLFWAVTVVNAPREMPGVRLAVGSNAASVWWVNGEEVISLYNDRQAVIDDGVSKRLTLKQGPNVLRAVIINAGGATDYCARFLDAENNPVKGLAVNLDADGKAADSVAGGIIIDYCVVLVTSHVVGSRIARLPTGQQTHPSSIASASFRRAIQRC